MVARLRKLGAEAIEFGLQCGDFVVQDDRGHGRGPVGLGCRWVVYATLSHTPSCPIPPKTCDRLPVLNLVPMLAQNGTEAAVRCLTSAHVDCFMNSWRED